MTDDELIALKDRAAAQLLSIPGVTGVGLGGRERAGQPTGEVVLKVFVERKQPTENLTSGELLPAQFEGLGVDVVELPAPYLEVAAPPQPGSPGTSENDLDQDDRRPLKGGTCVQVSLSGSGLGTLGCFLIDPADPAKVYALTNFHVVSTEKGAKPVAGTTKIGQPDTQDGPTKCCSNIIGTFAAGSITAVRDAAVVRLNGGTTWLAEIKEIGVVAGIHSLTIAEVTPLTYQVRKRGMRTRFTGGTVEGINGTFTVGGVTHTNVTVVKPNPNPGVRAGRPVYFSDQGDSGSAVVNDQNEIVALHFAGAQQGALHKGLELPIADILAQFKTIDGLTLQVATATNVGQVKTVPGPPPAPQPGPQLLRARAVSGAGRSGTEPLDAGPSDAMNRLGRDLGASSAGRTLRRLWLDHGTELLDLVNTRRRVTLAWHREGGPALTQTFLRLAIDPRAQLPAAIGGQPLRIRLARIHAILHANASLDMRAALDEAYAALPDPAGHTYDQLMAALAER